MYEAVGALQNPEIYIATGLLTHSSRSAQFLLPDPVARAITMSVFKYTMELLSCDLIWLRRYSHEPPGRFASPLGEESAIAALQTLRGWYSCLLAAEATVADKEC